MGFMTLLEVLCYQTSVIEVANDFCNNCNLFLITLPALYFKYTFCHFGIVLTNPSSTQSTMCKPTVVSGYHENSGVENIEGRGENAGYQHFLLFPQCFQKHSFSVSLKLLIDW